MYNNKKSHGEILEPRMRELHGKFETLRFDEELFKIIHFPGYTTPAEFFLIRQNLEMMHQLADMLSIQMQNILIGSEKIIAEVRQEAAV